MPTDTSSTDSDASTDESPTCLVSDGQTEHAFELDLAAVLISNTVTGSDGMGQWMLTEVADDGQSITVTAVDANGRPVTLEYALSQVIVPTDDPDAFGGRWELYRAGGEPDEDSPTLQFGELEASLPEDVDVLVEHTDNMAFQEDFIEATGFDTSGSENPREDGQWPHRYEIYWVLKQGYFGRDPDATFYTHPSVSE